MYVTAKVTDEKESPLQGARVTVENFEGAGVATGVTDITGSTTFLVPEDQTLNQVRVSATGYDEMIWQPVQPQLGTIMLHKHSFFPWWLLLVAAGTWYVIRQKK